jgi:hypothetical protein
MFQLFELILASPIGALIVAGVQDVIFAALVISDCEDCGFEDLGRLLFGGLILAIIAGVGISLIWRRFREHGTEDSGFVSIHSRDRK